MVHPYETGITNPGAKRLEVTPLNWEELGSPSFCFQLWLVSSYEVILS